MERIESINSDRIEWCCKDRGISPQDLAIDLDFSWDRFRESLAQSGGLTFNQLRSVAGYFNRSILFFMESGPVTAEKVYTPQFRTLANQKPSVSHRIRALIERVERQRDIFVSLREELEDEEQITFEPPEFRNRNVRLAARTTRQWLDLQEKNDFTTYRQAVESKGILVFRSNGYNGPWQIPKEDPICGFTVYDPDCPVIVVKKLPFESRQVFTLMHELGHVLIHRKSFIDDEGDLDSYLGKEKTANAFAGYLLVPDDFLEDIDDLSRHHDVSDYDKWLHPYAKKWGVSPEVILRRLLDSDRLSQVGYKKYRSWRKKQTFPESDGGARLYRHREPKHIFGDPFVSTVLDALHAKRISLAKASTYLDNLKISDVHKLEDFYAGS